MIKPEIKRFDQNYICILCKQPYMGLIYKIGLYYTEFNFCRCCEQLFIRYSNGGYKHSVSKLNHKSIEHLESLKLYNYCFTLFRRSLNENQI